MTMKTDHQCSHPDHKAGETCQEHTLACSKTCPCCLDTWALQFYARQAELKKGEKKNDIAA